MSHLLIWGNAYAQIIRDGAGRVLALYPLLPNKMDVQRDDKGEIYYVYSRSSDENPNFKEYGDIKLKKEDVLVDKASILIILDRNKALRLVYKTWAIEKRKSEENSVSLNLDDYKNDGKDYSIEYIYNVLVLNLPSNPSSTNYQTSLYKYQQADDGSFDVDRLAVQVEGNGQYFERNLMDLFYGKYQDLWKYIYKYDVNYRNDYDMVVLSKKISRVVAFSISSFVFFGVFPLVNKNGSTIFEKKKKLGYVNSNDLFEIKPYKNILRPFIYFTLPAIGIYFFSRYTVILLSVLPIFINFIFIFLSKDNKDIYERLARTKSISLEESKILKNEEEFKEFAAKEEIENEEYLKTLENVKNANIERKDV